MLVVVLRSLQRHPPPDLIGVSYPIRRCGTHTSDLRQENQVLAKLKTSLRTLTTLGRSESFCVSVAHRGQEMQRDLLYHEEPSNF